ncbi:hypothetical protein [Actinoplanes sp. L3-i22]|uniref:hypothetical protein n=1 Tax=Actinoplanes sp. L3-i22 TaxID=2836373 RepID=UPI001C78919A|nr:hypothetical protein [Actinoplanes sp. L3-i22]BCY13497.1 hypothetical protein L3i22_085850 [Actinoplanes sp. L3-i22]
MPALPNAEILEHPASTWADYRRFPRLRHLRLHLSGAGDFRLGGPPLTELRSLKITGLPGRPWGQAALPPNAEELDLHGAGELWLADTWPAGLRRLTLWGDVVAGPARLPARLDSLALHGGDHSALLAGVRELGSLTMRGTPVTDEVLPALGRFALTHLDVVGTRITPAALARFRAAHPAVGVLPRVPGTTPEFTDPAYAEAAIELREKRRAEDTHE